MTRRGKFVRKEALAYLASQDRLKAQFREQMRERGWEPLPGQTSLAINITISPTRHNRDLDNSVKALEDAAQGIVFPDDRWVDSILAMRIKGKDDVVHFVVWEREDLVFE